MFSLESPHRDAYTQYTIFHINTKNHPNLSQNCSYVFFQETQSLVRNSRGKRVISVRANEVQQYHNYKRKKKAF